MIRWSDCHISLNCQWYLYDFHSTTSTNIQWNLNFQLFSNSAWWWALGQGLLKTYVINSFPLDRKYWRYVFLSKWNVRLPVVKKSVFFIMFHFSLICLLKYYKSSSKVDIFTSWNKSFHFKKIEFYGDSINGLFWNKMHLQIEEKVKTLFFLFNFVFDSIFE